MGVSEVWEGKNVVDFVDPDIEAKLAALEEEEEERRGREGGREGRRDRYLRTTHCSIYSFPPFSNITGVGARARRGYGGVVGARRGG